MEKFELKESIKIPRILIDYKNGKIRITGKSSLNNPDELYPRLIDLFQLYIQNPQLVTYVLIDLEFYNAESAKYLFTIIEMLIALHQEKKSQLKITWHYDPDDYSIINDINKICNHLSYNINALAYELA
jgi:SiaC family regulatory phosphoprotein